MSGARQPEFSALLLQPFYESAPMSKQSQESRPRRRTIAGGYLSAIVPDFLSDHSAWPLKSWEPQIIRALSQCRGFPSLPHCRLRAHSSTAERAALELTSDFNRLFLEQ